VTGPSRAGRTRAARSKPPVILTDRGERLLGYLWATGVLVAAAVGFLVVMGFVGWLESQVAP
jgi:hypothetical protein